MVRFPKAYTMVIDEQVKAMAIKDVSTFGADDFIAKAFVYLDCSRVKDDMRMMQTVIHIIKRLVRQKVVRYTTLKLGC